MRVARYRPLTVKAQPDCSASMISQWWESGSESVHAHFLRTGPTGFEISAFLRRLLGNHVRSVVLPSSWGLQLVRDIGGVRSDLGLASAVVHGRR